MKALEGIRVLDLTNVLAGPFATLHLALLGAKSSRLKIRKAGIWHENWATCPSTTRCCWGPVSLHRTRTRSH
jgi:hypothetical protein